MVIGKHAISQNTPGNILLGAGTFHKGLKWDSSAKAWTGTAIGATNGGGKISIAGELMDIELDGMLVKTKGMTIKQGGKASAEVNFAELSTEIMKMGTFFEEGTSDVTGYTLLQDKARITEGDYIDGFGFVGYTADESKQIIVIFESAICTSGLEIEGKNKEQATFKLTLEAVAENAGNLDTLPIKIYYPEVPVV